MGDLEDKVEFLETTKEIVLEDPYAPPPTFSATSLELKALCVGLRVASTHQAFPMKST